MSRRFAAVAAIGLLVTACGGPGAAGTATPGSEGTPAASGETGELPFGPYCGEDCQQALTLEAAPEDVSCTVGLSWNGADHPYGAVTVDRTEAAAEYFPNMELIVADGRSDPTLQASQVEDLIARDIDVLIVSPADAEALVPSVERAMEAGIKVIAADREVGVDVLSYIGSDNVEAGHVAGQNVVDMLGGEGKVLEIQGSLGASPTIDRHAGFTSAIEGTDIEVLGSPNGDYNRQTALEVMEDYLQRYGPGEIDAIFTHDDEMALGALQAIEEAGREDEIVIQGIDGMQEALEAIDAGRYDGTVVYPITAPDHVVAAAKACAGEEIPSRIVLDSMLVTEDNVKDILGTTF